MSVNNLKTAGAEEGGGGGVNGGVSFANSVCEQFQA